MKESLGGGWFIERGREIDVKYRDDEWSDALLALGGSRGRPDLKPIRDHPIAIAFHETIEDLGLALR